MLVSSFAYVLRLADVAMDKKMVGVMFLAIIIKLEGTHQDEGVRTRDLHLVNNQFESRTEPSDGYRLATAK